MFLNNIIKGYIGSILDSYVDSSNKHMDLDLSLFGKQTVRLDNLKIRCDAINAFLTSLPIRLTSFYIGKVELDIPLLSIGSKPTRLAFYDALMFGKIVKEGEWSEEDAKKELSEAFKAAILVIWTEIIDRSNGIDPNTTGLYYNTNGMLNKTITKLIENIQMEFHNVHLKIESPPPLRTVNGHTEWILPSSSSSSLSAVTAPSLHSHAVNDTNIHNVMSIYAHVSSMVLRTTDENWRPYFNPNLDFLSYKILSIEDFELHWICSDSNPISKLVSLNPIYTEFAEQKEYIVQNEYYNTYIKPRNGGFHTPLIEKFSITLRFKLNAAPYHHPGDPYRIDALIDVSPLKINLTMEQTEQILNILSLLSQYSQWYQQVTDRFNRVRAHLRKSKDMELSASQSSAGASDLLSDDHYHDRVYRIYDDMCNDRIRFIKSKAKEPTNDAEFTRKNKDREDIEMLLELSDIRECVERGFFPQEKILQPTVLPIVGNPPRPVRASSLSRASSASSTNSSKQTPEEIHPIIGHLAQSAGYDVAEFNKRVTRELKESNQLEEQDRHSSKDLSKLPKLGEKKEDEIEYEVPRGSSLGFELHQDHDSPFAPVYIKSILPDAASTESLLTPGLAIVGINKYSVENSRFEDIDKYLKSTAKPLTIRFRKRDASNTKYEEKEAKLIKLLIVCPEIAIRISDSINPLPIVAFSVYGLACSYGVTSLLATLTSTMMERLSVPEKTSIGLCIVSLSVSDSDEDHIPLLSSFALAPSTIVQEESASQMNVQSQRRPSLLAASKSDTSVRFEYQFSDNGSDMEGMTSIVATAKSLYESEGWRKYVMKSLTHIRTENKSSFLLEQAKLNPFLYLEYISTASKNHAKVEMKVGKLQLTPWIPSINKMLAIQAKISEISSLSAGPAIPLSNIVPTTANSNTNYELDISVGSLNIILISDLLDEICRPPDLSYINLYMGPLELLTLKENEEEGIVKNEHKIQLSHFGISLYTSASRLNEFGKGKIGTSRSFDGNSNHYRQVIFSTSQMTVLDFSIMSSSRLRLPYDQSNATEITLDASEIYMSIDEPLYISLLRVAAGLMISFSHLGNNDDPQQQKQQDQTANESSEEVFNYFLRMNSVIAQEQFSLDIDEQEIVDLVKSITTKVYGHEIINELPSPKPTDTEALEFYCILEVELKSIKNAKSIENKIKEVPVTILQQYQTIIDISNAIYCYLTDTQIMIDNKAFEDSKDEASDGSDDDEINKANQDGNEPVQKFEISFRGFTLNLFSVAQLNLRSIALFFESSDTKTFTCISVDKVMLIDLMHNVKIIDQRIKAESVDQHPRSIHSKNTIMSGARADSILGLKELLKNSPKSMIYLSYTLEKHQSPVNNSLQKTGSKRAHWIRNLARETAIFGGYEKELLERYLDASPKIMEAIRSDSRKFNSNVVLGAHILALREELLKHPRVSRDAKDMETSNIAEEIDENKLQLSKRGTLGNNDKLAKQPMKRDDKSKKKKSVRALYSETGQLARSLRLFGILSDVRKKLMSYGSLSSTRSSDDTRSVDGRANVSSQRTRSSAKRDKKVINKVERAEKSKLSHEITDIPTNIDFKDSTDDVPPNINIEMCLQSVNLEINYTFFDFLLSLNSKLSPALAWLPGSDVQQDTKIGDENATNIQNEAEAAATVTEILPLQDPSIYSGVSFSFALRDSELCVEATSPEQQKNGMKLTLSLMTSFEMIFLAKQLLETASIFISQTSLSMKYASSDGDIISNSLSNKLNTRSHLHGGDHGSRHMRIGSHGVAGMALAALKDRRISTTHNLISPWEGEIRYSLHREASQPDRLLRNLTGDILPIYISVWTNDFTVLATIPESLSYQFSVVLPQKTKGYESLIKRKTNDIIQYKTREINRRNSKIVKSTPGKDIKVDQSQISTNLSNEKDNKDNSKQMSPKIKSKRSMMRRQSSIIVRETADKIADLKNKRKLNMISAEEYETAMADIKTAEKSALTNIVSNSSLNTLSNNEEIDTNSLARQTSTHTYATANSFPTTLSSPHSQHQQPHIFNQRSISEPETKSPLSIVSIPSSILTAIFGDSWMVSDSVVSAKVACRLNNLVRRGLQFQKLHEPVLSLSAVNWLQALVQDINNQTTHFNTSKMRAYDDINAGEADSTAIDDFIEIHMSKISIEVVKPAMVSITVEAFLPVMVLKFKPTVIRVNSNTGFKDDTATSFQSNVQMKFYNRRLAVWEPLLEGCDLEMVTSNDTSSNETETTLHIRHRVNFNISDDVLFLASKLINELKRPLDEFISRQKEEEVNNDMSMVSSVNDSTSMMKDGLNTSKNEKPATLLQTINNPNPTRSSNANRSEFLKALRNASSKKAFEMADPSMQFGRFRRNVYYSGLDLQKINVSSLERRYQVGYESMMSSKVVNVPFQKSNYWLVNRTGILLTLQDLFQIGCAEPGIINIQVLDGWSYPSRTRWSNPPQIRMALLPWGDPAVDNLDAIERFKKRIEKAKGGKGQKESKREKHKQEDEEKEDIGDDPLLTYETADEDNVETDGENRKVMINNDEEKHNEPQKIKSKRFGSDSIVRFSMRYPGAKSVDIFPMIRLEVKDDDGSLLTADIDLVPYIVIPGQISNNWIKLNLVESVPARCGGEILIKLEFIGDTHTNRIIDSTNDLEFNPSGIASRGIAPINFDSLAHQRWYSTVGRRDLFSQSIGRSETTMRRLCLDFGPGLGIGKSREILSIMPVDDANSFMLRVPLPIKYSSQDSKSIHVAVTPMAMGSGFRKMLLLQSPLSIKNSTTEPMEILICEKDNSSFYLETTHPTNNQLLRVPVESAIVSSSGNFLTPYGLGLFSLFDRSPGTKWVDGGYDIEGENISNKTQIELEDVDVSEEEKKNDEGAHHIMDQPHSWIEFSFPTHYKIASYQVSYSIAASKTETKLGMGMEGIIDAFSLGQPPTGWVLSAKKSANSEWIPISYENDIQFSMLDKPMVHDPDRNSPEPEADEHTNDNDKRTLEDALRGQLKTNVLDFNVRHPDWYTHYRIDFHLGKLLDHSRDSSSGLIAKHQGPDDKLMDVVAANRGPGGRHAAIGLNSLEFFSERVDQLDMRQDDMLHKIGDLSNRNEDNQPQRIELESDDKWECPLCKDLNAGGDICSLCRNPRPDGNELNRSLFLNPQAEQRMSMFLSDKIPTTSSTPPTGIEPPKETNPKDYQQNFIKNIQSALDNPSKLESPQFYGILTQRSQVASDGQKTPSKDPMAKINEKSSLIFWKSQPRFAVLTPNGLVIYRENKSLVKSAILFTKKSIVSTDSKKGGTKVIEVTGIPVLIQGSKISLNEKDTQLNKYELVAPSVQLAKEWVKHISGVIERIKSKERGTLSQNMTRILPPGEKMEIPIRYLCPFHDFDEKDPDGTKDSGSISWSLCARPYPRYIDSQNNIMHNWAVIVDDLTTYIGEKGNHNSSGNVAASAEKKKDLAAERKYIRYLHSGCIVDKRLTKEHLNKYLRKVTSRKNPKGVTITSTRVNSSNTITSEYDEDDVAEEESNDIIKAKNDNEPPNTSGADLSLQNRSSQRSLALGSMTKLDSGASMADKQGKDVIDKPNNETKENETKDNEDKSNTNEENEDAYDINDDNDGAKQGMSSNEFIRATTGFSFCAKVSARELPSYCGTYDTGTDIPKNGYEPGKFVSKKMIHFHPWLILQNDLPYPFKFVFVQRPAQDVVDDGSVSQLDSYIGPGEERSFTRVNSSMYMRVRLDGLNTRWSDAISLQFKPSASHNPDEGNDSSVRQEVISFWSQDSSSGKEGDVILKLVVERSLDPKGSMRLIIYSKFWVYNFSDVPLLIKSNKSFLGSNKAYETYLPPNFIQTLPDIPSLSSATVSDAASTTLSANATGSKPANTKEDPRKHLLPALMHFSTNTAQISCLYTPLPSIEYNEDAIGSKNLNKRRHLLHIKMKERLRNFYQNYFHGLIGWDETLSSSTTASRNLNQTAVQGQQKEEESVFTFKKKQAHQTAVPVQRWKRNFLATNKIPSQTLQSGWNSSLELYQFGESSETFIFNIRGQVVRQHIGIEVTGQSDARFSRTIQLIIRPRYVIINRIPEFPLHFIQHSSTSLFMETIKTYIKRRKSKYKNSHTIKQAVMAAAKSTRSSSAPADTKKTINALLSNASSSGWLDDEDLEESNKNLKYKRQSSEDAKSEHPEDTSDAGNNHDDVASDRGSQDTEHFISKEEHSLEERYQDAVGEDDNNNTDRSPAVKLDPLNTLDLLKLEEDDDNDDAKEANERKDSNDKMNSRNMIKSHLDSHHLDKVLKGTSNSMKKQMILEGKYLSLLLINDPNRSEIFHFRGTENKSSFTVRAEGTRWSGEIDLKEELEVSALLRSFANNSPDESEGAKRVRVLVRNSHATTFVIFTSDDVDKEVEVIAPPQSLPVSPSTSQGQSVARQSLATTPRYITHSESQRGIPEGPYPALTPKPTALQLSELGTAKVEKTFVKVSFFRIENNSPFGFEIRQNSAKKMRGNIIVYPKSQLSLAWDEPMKPTSVRIRALCPIRFSSIKDYESAMTVRNQISSISSMGIDMFVSFTDAEKIVVRSGDENAVDELLKHYKDLKSRNDASLSDIDSGRVLLWAVASEFRAYPLETVSELAPIIVHWRNSAKDTTTRDFKINVTGDVDYVTRLLRLHCYDSLFTAPKRIIDNPSLTTTAQNLDSSLGIASQADMTNGAMHVSSTMDITKMTDQTHEEKEEQEEDLSMFYDASTFEEHEIQRSLTNDESKITNGDGVNQNDGNELKHDEKNSIHQLQQKKPNDEEDEDNDDDDDEYLAELDESSQKSLFTIRIHVMEAIGLKFIESLVLDTVDPFVVVTCGSERKQTSIKLDCRNPKWKKREGTLEFHLQEPPRDIQFTVFDQNKNNERRLLGWARVKLFKSLWKAKGEWITIGSKEWIRLMSSSKNDKDTYRKLLRLRLGLERFVYITSNDAMSTVNEHVNAELAQHDKEGDTDFIPLQYENSGEQYTYNFMEKDSLRIDHGKIKARIMCLRNTAMPDPLETRLRLFLSSFGISLVNAEKQNEIAYICLQRIRMRSISQPLSADYEMHVGNLQIDNQANVNSRYPVILAPNRTLINTPSGKVLSSSDCLNMRLLLHFENPTVHHIELFHMNLAQLNFSMDEEFVASLAGINSSGAITALSEANDPTLNTKSKNQKDESTLYARGMKQPTMQQDIALYGQRMLLFYINRGDLGDSTNMHDRHSILKVNDSSAINNHDQLHKGKSKDKQMKLLIEYLILHPSISQPDLVGAFSTQMVYIDAIDINKIVLRIQLDLDGGKKIAKNQDDISMSLRGYIPTLKVSDLSLNMLGYRNNGVFQPVPEFTRKVTRHYFYQAVINSHKIFASVNYFGNPLQSAVKVGGGFRQAVLLPVDGAREGTCASCWTGVQRGFTALIAGVAGGMTEMVYGVSSAVVRSVETLAIESSYDITIRPTAAMFAVLRDITGAVADGSNQLSAEVIGGSTRSGRVREPRTFTDRGVMVVYGYGHIPATSVERRERKAALQIARWWGKYKPRKGSEPGQHRKKARMYILMRERADQERELARKQNKFLGFIPRDICKCGSEGVGKFCLILRETHEMNKRKDQEEAYQKLNQDDKL